MRYASLGSGSRGNATIVLQEDRGVLIDCGFNRKTILQRLQDANIDPRQLDGVFVTHEHGDHAKGVAALCEVLNIPFFASFGTARKMQWTDNPRWRCIHSDQVVSVGGLAVLPVVVPHDAEEPLQFVLENSAEKRLGVLSDLGSLTPHIVSVYQRCHALQVEANHDPMLLQNGPYPPSLRARVAGNFGHLSNQQCAELISRVRWDGLQYVTAGHISEKNNDRALVSQTLSQALECAPHEVSLLQQDQVSAWRQL